KINFSAPTSTRMLGPKRSKTGGGAAVPNSVTLKISSACFSMNPPRERHCKTDRKSSISTERVKEKNATYLIPWSCADMFQCVVSRLTNHFWRSDRPCTRSYICLHYHNWFCDQLIY